MTDNERNTLQETITHFLEDMKKEQGDSFSLEKVNPLLRLSKLPTKVPKTFETYDFSRVHGTK